MKNTHVVRVATQLFLLAVVTSTSAIAPSECVDVVDPNEDPSGCTSTTCAKACAATCGWMGSGCVAGSHSPPHDGAAECEVEAPNNMIGGNADCETLPLDTQTLDEIRAFAQRTEHCDSQKWVNHGWTTRNGQVVRLTDRRLNWTSSRAACQTWGQGFDLYVPVSSEDMRFLIDVVSDNDGSSGTDVWAGVLFNGDDRVTTSGAPHIDDGVRFTTETTELGSDRCVAGKRRSGGGPSYLIKSCADLEQGMCAGPTGSAFPVFLPLAVPELTARTGRPNIVLLMAGMCG
jgi:hypothetical protein